MEGGGKNSNKTLKGGNKITVAANQMVKLHHHDIFLKRETRLWTKKIYEKKKNLKKKYRKKIKMKKKILLSLPPPKK